MYYALNRYRSYSEALDKMGYLYVTPTNFEHEDWVERTVKATNSFIETAVFKNEVEVKLEEPESPPKPNEKQPFNVNVVFVIGGIIFLIALALRGR